MTTQKATRLIGASLAQIRQALLDPGALPEWNPAFQSVGGPDLASTGTTYPIKVRGLTGTWEYAAIEELRIDTTWQVPGFHETGSWVFEQRGDQTLVRHEFQHRGALARLLSKAYEGVADLRLDRLTERTAR